VSHRVSIADALATVTVELWGHEFEVQKVTRSAKTRLQPLSEKIDEAEDDDAWIDAVGALWDERLKPSDTKRTKPSKLLHDKWHADDVSVMQVVATLQDIGGAELGIDRPT
jgi:hypothetical protein